MQDGHECVEINYSQLERTHRIDAEFYKKKNLDVTTVLKKMAVASICDNFKISDGNHMSISDHFCDSGVPYYRGQDIYHLFIEDANPQFIDKEIYDKPLMVRSHLKKNDVLISIVGAIVGNCAIVSSDNDATCSCKLAIIRVKNEMILPEMLLLFLKSEYGQNQIQKFKRGTAQTGLLLEDFDQLYIPIFGMDFQNKIKDCFSKIRNLSNKTVLAYEEAESILLSEIGINAINLPNGGTSIKLFSESFAVSGRLDAEYYQPKYDKLIDAIEKVPHEKLKYIVSISKSIEPGSDAYCDEGIPFIRVSDISKYEISTPDKYLEPGSEFDDSTYYLKKDEILFSKDGSVGIAYKMELDASMITSSALLHLKVKNNSKVLPDYLTTVLNSEVIQLQAQRDAGGSIIKHWKPSEIEEVLIPILDITKQKLVSEKAIYSFDLRYRFKQLLECATDAVEMAIEQDEITAINWLETKMNELA